MIDVEQPRSLCIVVPVLNERAVLPELVNHLAQLGADQVVIVDGGSGDGSLQWLTSFWENQQQGNFLATSHSGRASQMNAGAAYARADMLLFLHADSRLPLQAKAEILEAREQQRLWGRFDVKFIAEAEFDRHNIYAHVFDFWMSVIALFMNVRSRLSSVATGDQAIFIDHATFQQVGGFANLPIMEDVAISKVLKRYCVPYCSRLKVTTSARRWRAAGLAKTVLTMWYLRLAYSLGVPPKRLYKSYQNLK